ncbi:MULTISPECIES: beta family protein [Tepidanaerobacter]|uniref:beta family protein n=1 Tax=Tepidanaerobacter TaxID=499228 RepID=UPI000A8118CA|nr:MULTISPECIES: beta family protein [Tepidanaerobacter]
MLEQHNFYTPILQWKRGEQKALEYLNESIKEKILPLIEIVPVPWDYDNDTPAKILDKHLENIGDSLQKSLAPNNILFLDLNFLDENKNLQNGQNPLTYIINEAKKKALKVIPVTGLNRDSNYQNEVNNAYLTDKLGICLRIVDDDLLDIDINVKNFLSNINIKPSDIYLMLDLKYVSPNEEKKNIISTINIINSLPYLGEWKEIILSATSFPENLSLVQSNSVEYIARSEWNIWKYIYDHKNKIKRMPWYSDYAISNPGLLEIDPRIMMMSANIRYTAEDNFVIVKGTNVKKNGWGQIHDLCKALINMKEYAGQNFSWGDEYIYQCASGSANTGNAEIWRRIGTNHHISFVVNQLSNLICF